MATPYGNCTRFLNGHGPRCPREKLQEALEVLEPEEAADIYGKGDALEDFEKQLALRLGKEAAVFMPSGTMAQQIALRIWCDKAQNKRVALHATSHLQLHEQGAISELHGIALDLLGSGQRLFDRQDLEALDTLPGAILWELPQREIGGQLPSWERLVDETEWARSKSLRRHLDGARLWEAQPFYQRSHAEICAHFDSVYVSFYKGLGGIAGALLAGPEDFVQASRPWLRRHGGNLISMYPFVLSARAGLQTHLAHFGDYAERAREIAKALTTVDGIAVVPEIPPTPMMHLHLEAEAEALTAANHRLAAESKVMLFGRATPRPEGGSKIELSIGGAADALHTEEVVALFESLLGSL